jgi:hypothetical protein
MKTANQKKTEAEARNAEWAKLTGVQKLARLDALQLRAEKQRRKWGQVDAKGDTIIPEGCVN